jgi:hypothetical protein
MTGRASWPWAVAVADHIWSIEEIVACSSARVRPIDRRNLGITGECDVTDVWWRLADACENDPWPNPQI